MLFLFLTFSINLLNIFSALFIYSAAKLYRTDFIIISLIILFFVLVNIIKFVLYNYAYKKYNISTILPLTAIFFPLISIINFFLIKEINFGEILGVILITYGVYLIFKDTNDLRKVG